MNGATCCEACREYRADDKGPSRRWALTPEGNAALDGYVYVRFPDKAQLEEIAERNRRAL